MGLILRKMISRGHCEIITIVIICRFEVDIHHNNVCSCYVYRKFKALDYKTKVYVTGCKKSGLNQVMNPLRLAYCNSAQII